MDFPINVEKSFEQVTAYWSPLVIAEMNDQYIKVAKVKGELVWHDHEHEDEFFFIVKGQLKIELKSSQVVLNEGEFYVVPKGVQHKPSAEEECWILLIEPKTTAHTGKTASPYTKSIAQQLNPLKKD